MNAYNKNSPKNNNNRVTKINSKMKSNMFLNSMTIANPS